MLYRQGYPRGVGDAQGRQALSGIAADHLLWQGQGCGRRRAGQRTLEAADGGAGCCCDNDLLREVFLNKKARCP
ncbi:hypothetical protein GCM10027514_19850 [Azotobacter armeniacus]